MEFRSIAIVPSVIVAVAGAATSAAAQVGEIPDQYGAFNYAHGMMWGSNQWGGFGMVLGPVFMILIMVGIVAAVIYLMRHFGTAGTGGGHLAHDRALFLLKERYAKGEIDSVEFAERKKLLAD